MSARAWEVFRVALVLGLTSFGGPIAHLGYFEHAYVRRRRWLSGEEYGRIVALGQVLPGPASSQVGFLIGVLRAGWIGGVAAWAGFTLPSAIVLYLAARLLAHVDGAQVDAIMHGLQLVAVPIVAQAVWTMARRLCTDRPTRAIALLAGVAMVLLDGPLAQMAVLIVAALCGAWCCSDAAPATAGTGLRIGARAAWFSLLAFAALLCTMPLLAAPRPQGYVAFFDVFYRAGALVFGGGHVVLPLLRDALVPAGWLSDDRFLAGYGLAQAIPGPLFALSAYLGAANAVIASPVAAAALAVVAIFLPGLLIAVAGAGLWTGFARHPRLRAALLGVNAAVVGILAAALYDPVWTASVSNVADAAIAFAALLLLVRGRLPPVVLVAICIALSLLAKLI